MRSRTRTTLLLIIPLCLVPQVGAAGFSAPQKTSFLSSGVSLGEDTVEAYSDLLFPLFATPGNTLFLNPRIPLNDIDEKEFNVGLGYRHKLAGWIVGGTNAWFGSRESEHNNRFNTWGLGLELFSDYVDFRANFYDADNSRQRIASYNETLTESVTRTRYRYGTPWATHHEIVANRTRTDRTSTTVTKKVFDQFEAAMDGWDTEIGCKIPFNTGPEIRLFAGYYGYRNPEGEDFSGGKGRLEVKTGSWLTFDTELFEDKELHGTNYFVGLRLQIPLSSALSWEKFKKGLISGSHRDLDDRMRSEMVLRDVKVETGESDWEEDPTKREVSHSVSESSSTTQVTLVDHITFVDGDNLQSGQDGSNENPYNTIGEGVDKAGANNTIFVYEKGGTVSRPGPADGGSSYDEQVVLKEGQTLTSTIVWPGHSGGVYKTERRPIIRPTMVRVEQPAEVNGSAVTVAPVVSMAPGAVVERIEIDATAPDFAAYATGSDGTRAAPGLYADISRTESVTLRAEDSRIVTFGGWSPGVFILAEESAGAAVDVSSTEIATEGFHSYGMHIAADNSTDAVIDVSATEIAARGMNAPGMYISADDSANMDVDVSQTRIATSGEYSSGMVLDADNSAGAAIGVSATAITTSGYNADGIRIRAGSNPIANTIRDNILTVDQGWGIFVTGDSSGSFDRTTLETGNIFSLGPGSFGEVEVLP